MQVLLIATRYDLPTMLSHQWATSLHERLVRGRHVCNLLTAEPLCRNGNVMSEAIDRADFVVFFGHGRVDGWIGLPAGSGVGEVTIVDSTTIGTLGGRSLYAGCCDSFAGLAAASSGPYVGYDHPFAFETVNHLAFGRVVVDSVMDFVNGRPAVDIESDLRSQWGRLRDDFVVGSLRHSPNAIMAAHCADTNAQRIRGK